MGKKKRGVPELRPFTDEEMRQARPGISISRVHEVDAYRAGIEMGREQIEQRQRTKCTVCGDPYKWFQLEPGTGRCTTCQP